MALVKRTPSLSPILNSFFNDFWTRSPFDGNWSDFSSTGTTIPAVNIVETNEDFRVEVAAPGMKKDDFHVSLDNDMLLISSEKTEEEKGDEKYSQREFSYQSFSRTFYLPNTVETEKIQAKYQDGILHLIIPKKEEAKKKSPKQIKVS